MLFCCFEAFLLKLSKKLTFRSKKGFLHPNEPHTAALSFSTFLNHFYINLQKKNCYLGPKKCSHQIEPHTAALCLSAILKHFYVNREKKSFWQKVFFSSK